MTSINACLSPPPLPDFVFRARLATIREHLHQLEGCCPPGHVAGVADILEILEAELASLGCVIPEEPLSDHDREFLAICETSRSAR